MAYSDKSFGGAIDKIFDNDFITRKELEDVLKQRQVTEHFYQIEPLEVLDIYRQGGRVSQPGAVIGRYIISEQNQNSDECLEFYPLSSNIHQQPIVGEVYLGLSFRGERYYFGRLTNNTTQINSQNFNISGITDNTSLIGENGNVLNSENVKNKRPFKQGVNFVNDYPNRLVFSEGDTTIEGRYKNSIRLGNNDSLNSGNIKLVAGCQTGIEDLTIDKTSLYMTSNEEVILSEPSKNFVSSDYTKPQIVLDTDRIILNAKTDEIGLFSEKDINISSEQGDVLITSNKVIELKPKGSQIINNIKSGGTILNATKEGIPFPQLDIVGFLKQVMGIQQFLQAMTIGVPKLSNPVTLPSGVRDIVKGLQGAKNFIDATINLEFLSKALMETKTIEEIKAVLPIPAGFDGIIDDISNITDEQISKLKELEKSVSDKIESASQLNDLLSGDSLNASGISQLLDSGNFDGFQGVEDLKSVIANGTDGKDLANYVQQGGISNFQQEVSDLGSIVGVADQAQSYQNLFNTARS